ncbi:MAG: phage tail tape measure protein, partial [Phycisphaerales bacterium]
MSSQRGIRAGRAFIELFADDRRLVRGLRRAQARLRAFGSSVRQIGQRMLAMSAAAGSIFAISTRQFAGFDDRMRAVQAVTGATEDQFRSLREEAKRLGRTTSFTAGEVADAMTEMGRAGFDAGEILSSTEAVLALARATSTDLPRATEIAGAVLRAFRLEADETGRVSDVLSAAANQSAQTLGQLFEALRPVAPIAAAAGESLEETAAALAVLANNGIKGSMAGTALARALRNVATEAGQRQLAEVGVQAVDAAGDLRPIVDIINDLAEATENMGGARRLALFESLFGRGQAAALVLAEGGEAFDELAESIRNSAGDAQRTAEQMDAGIGGSFRRLVSAVEGVAIAIGEAIEEPVRKAADLLGRFSGFITQLVNRNQALVQFAFKATVAFAAFGVVLIATGLAITITSIAMGGLATGAAVLLKVLALMGTVLAALLSPIGLVVAGVIALGVAIIHASGAGTTALQWLGERFQWLFGAAMRVIDGIRDALAAGDLSLAAQVLWAGLRVAWERGIAPLREMWTNFSAWFERSSVNTFSGAQKAWLRVRAWFEQNFPEFTLRVAQTWANLTAGLREVWARFQNWLSDRFLEMMGLFDDTLDVQAAQALGREELQSRVDDIEQSRHEAIAEAQRRAELSDEERQKELEQELKAIEQARKDAIDRIGQERDQRIEAAEEALRSAREQLEDART